MRVLKHIEQLTRIKTISTDEGDFLFRGVEYFDGVSYVLCEDYNGIARRYPTDELTEKCFVYD